MANTSQLSAGNRRSSPRKPARANVRLECRPGALGLGKSIALALLDVSETGVRLTVSADILVGREVEILFSGYSMLRHIKLLGNVCWNVPTSDGSWCIGVHFQKPLPYRDVQRVWRP